MMHRSDFVSSDETGAEDLRAGGLEQLEEGLPEVLR